VFEHQHNSAIEIRVDQRWRRHEQSAAQGSEE
jgi:hypothetical protein